jgi:hypothetical protein
MNWARYVEGMWGHKKGNKAEQQRCESAPTVRYKPMGSHMTYESKLLARLQRECRKEFKDYRDAGRELEQVRTNLTKLQERQSTDEVYNNAMAAVDREIIRHRLSLNLAKCNLYYAREFLRHVNVESELGLLEMYQMKEVEEQENLLESKRMLKAANI